MFYPSVADNFQVKSRLVIAHNECTHTSELFSKTNQIFAFGDSLLNIKQSKTFVLHQNQVSSCKGYGYWFKKFKDFPSQSSDGAPSFWSLFVATFRPTLDSTFNIITTRLEPAGPTGAKCTQSHFLVLMTPSCWLWSISCLYRWYRPVVDRRQHVASDPLRCSKASLNLLPSSPAVAALSAPTWGGGR